MKGSAMKRLLRHAGEASVDKYRLAQDLTAANLKAEADAKDLAAFRAFHDGIVEMAKQLLDGQPELREGAAVGRMLVELVTRLTKERDQAREDAKNAAAILAAYDIAPVQMHASDGRQAGGGQ